MDARDSLSTLTPCAPMSRDPIPTWFFAVVVVRKGDRYLLVQEARPGQPWYLPAGRVEPGESIHEAAVRETREEGGIPVRLTGIVRIDHTLVEEGARIRVVFVAEPTDETPPKSIADAESIRARWIRLEELDGYFLRGESVRDLLSWVDHGGPIYPLDVLRSEF